MFSRLCRKVCCLIFVQEVRGQFCNCLFVVGGHLVNNTMMFLIGVYISHAIKAQNYRLRWKVICMFPYKYNRDSITFVTLLFESLFEVCLQVVQVNCSFGVKMEIMRYTQRLLRICGFHFDHFWRFPKILWPLFWFTMATFNLAPIVSTSFVSHPRIY